MTRSSHSSAAKAYELMRSGRLQAALMHAEQAAAGATVCSPAHAFLASLLLKLGRVAEAEGVVDGARALPTGVADAYDGLAYVSMAMGRHDRANALYRRATELSPQVPHFWYNLAGSERSLGRLSEAVAACYRAIAIDPAQYSTYLLRSELRMQTSDSNHIAELSRLLDEAGADHRARVFLGYAIAKELDDVGRFD